MTTSSAANPILIELTRGSLVESFHRGAVSIMRANGAPVLSIGNVSRPIFPRSAFKALQAIPLVEEGTAGTFALGDKELALACASHSGEPMHLETARAMLAAAGFDDTALACGACLPLGAAAARALTMSGEPAKAVHNPCSGKHAAMLALARHMGEEPEGYERPDHPIQRRIRSAIESMAGETLGEDRCGIDGCSAPNWAVPLSGLAQGFARFISGEGLAPQRAEACARLARACMAEPEFVDGPGRFGAVAMTQLPNVFVKGGTEGVYCAALLEEGLGIALKIDDGAKRASEQVMAAVFATFIPGAETALSAFGPASLRNWRGLEVGHIGPSRELIEALDACIAHA